ncbi:hypothetical protein, conserved [Leishmania tarentolae]|uniref:Protein kinase domain-containing protein n=1 Tax=Leishmania tarentolae TaxID=5689 RepID=A0A640KUL6_LEITA|nr:hypothetical protein, conserved [Leishmania tarentolae]
MSAVLVDSHGDEYRLLQTIEPESGSYGALFAQAATYRAQQVLPPPKAETPGLAETNAGESGAKSLLGSAVVTYIPLTTSLQEGDSTSESALMHAVLQNIRLRRQVDHPYLRTLIDAFYTNQVLQSSNSVRHDTGRVADIKQPSASARNSSSSPKSLEKQSYTAHVGGDTNWRASTAVSGLHSPLALTALVVVEEYIEGCSLADYVDVVAKGHLQQENRQIQKATAAIAYQLAQALLHLHTVGLLLCRDLPFECVHMDVNKGYVRVRIPLSATAMLDAVEGSTSSAVTAFLPSPCTAPIADARSTAFGEGKCSLCAPEMTEMSEWNESVSEACGSLPFGADVWALGILMLQLCSLNQKDLFGTTNATERLLVIRSHLPHIVDLLPADIEGDMAELIGGCLQCSPRNRPTLSTLLKSSLFANHRSFTLLEPNPVIISDAEAVSDAKKQQGAFVSVQPTAPPSRAMNKVDTDFLHKVIDDSLISLSLKDMKWRTPRSFRDAFMPILAPPPGSTTSCEMLGGCASRDSAATPTMQSPQGLPLPLAAAAKQALHDITLLHDEYYDICVRAAQTSTSTTPSAETIACAALRERVQNSRQLSRDLTTTMTIMEDLTKHFTKLELSEPKLCIRLVEFLLEGFETSPSDIAAVTESITLADTLLHAASTNTVSPGGASVVHKEAPLDEATQHRVPQQKEAAFNVAKTLRVMPSMPAHMISSDRAANTSAVLYNSWLRKLRKKRLKMDEY